MTKAQSLFAEFEKELETTRRFLDRVPADRLAWKPHEKSMSLGQLANHIAALPFWGVVTMKEVELDMNPPGGPGYQTPKLDSVAAMIRSAPASRRASSSGSTCKSSMPNCSTL